MSDIRYLSKAFEKLKIKFKIEFQIRDENDFQGFDALKKVCVALSKTINQPYPQIFIFDDDNKVAENYKQQFSQNKNYLDLGNNVFVLVLPIPPNRLNYVNNICLEYYFTDDVITREDKNGKRMYLSNEFHIETGRHKKYTEISLDRRKSYPTKEGEPVKILDSHIYHFKNDKEVSIALSKNNFADNISKEISPFNDIDFSEFQKIFDVIEEILGETDINFFNNVPNPINDFTGYKDEIDLFKKYLKEPGIIYVQGISGIGKSQFVFECCDKLLKGNNIYYYDCTINSTFDEMANDLGFKYEDKELFVRYRNFTRHLKKEAAYLILDNVQKLDRDNIWGYLNSDFNSLGNARIIIISQKKSPLNELIYLLIYLDGIKEFKELMNKYLGTEFIQKVFTDNNLKSLKEKLFGHPYAIKVVSSLILAGMKVDEVIDEIWKLDAGDVIASRILKIIFKENKANKEEMDLLLMLAIINKPIKLDLFQKIYLGENFWKTKLSLNQKLLLDDRGDFLMLHPLLNEVLLNHKIELGAKIELAKKLSLSMEKIISNKYNYEELELIFELYFVAELFENIYDNLKKYRKELFRDKRYDFLERTAKRLKNKITEVSILHLIQGELYYHQDKYELAIDTFEKILSENCEVNIKAESYINIGMTLTKIGGSDNLKKGVNNLNHAFELIKNIDDTRIINQFWGGQAHIAAFRMDYKKAMEYYNLSSKYIIKKDKAELCVYYNNIAAMFTHLEQSKKALEFFSKSLEIEKKFNTYLNIASTYIELKKFELADENIKRAVKVGKNKLNYSEEISLHRAKSKLSYHLNNKYESLKEILISYALSIEIGVNKNYLVQAITILKKELTELTFEKYLIEILSNMKDFDEKIHTQIKNDFLIKRLKKQEQGRNDPCNCGSGKKYKHCCIK